MLALLCNNVNSILSVATGRVIDRCGAGISYIKDEPSYCVMLGAPYGHTLAYWNGIRMSLCVCVCVCVDAVCVCVCVCVCVEGVCVWWCVCVWMQCVCVCVRVRVCVYASV